MVMSREQSDVSLIATGGKLHPGRRMTWEEFHDWLDDTTRAEWVDGEVIILSPTTDTHQILISFVDTLLTLYAAKGDLGQIRVAPFLVRMGSTSREPDVLFIKKASEDRIHRTYVDGAPDLVIEVLSPSTRSVDRGAKYYEYEEAGIPEYWLIDPERQQAEFYRLNCAARYEVVPQEGGVFKSTALVGFHMKPDWLWNSPLANIHTTAREAGAL